LISARVALLVRRVATIVLFTVSLVGCASLTYYSQSVTGHLRLMAGREPIEDMVDSRDTSPEVRDKLRTVQAVRSFASEELRLPENRSYRYFTRLDRPYAVWNVVAAPRFSLEPKRWCFPIAGCVSYRGYFDREKAEAKARELEADGMDTAVLGASAYSTLGWFADPVLSPMLDLPEADLAGLIFHELAHQHLYVAGDTAFNEAFANVVEETGVKRWVEDQGRPDEIRQWREQRKWRAAVTGLLLDARRGLAELYEGSDALDEVALARRKTAIFAGLRKRYRALARTTDPATMHGLSEDMNNADLSMVGAYRGGAPAFRALPECLDGDLDAFYRAANRIGEWPADRRAAWLDVREPAPACTSRDEPGSG
jgi:predicted aminopeptidase